MTDYHRKNSAKTQKSWRGSCCALAVNVLLHKKRQSEIRVALLSILRVPKWLMQFSLSRHIVLKLTHRLRQEV